MTKSLLWLPLLLVLLTGCTLLGGGTQEDARTYLLLPEAPSTDPMLLPAPGPSLGLERVRVAAYLERQRIVSRGEGNTLYRAPFDLWAEPLSDSIARVVAANLEQILPARSVIFAPWRQGLAPDYRLRLRVLQLDGVMGKTAVLRATFAIQREDGEVLRQGSRQLTTPLAGADHKALVAGLNELLNRFSRQLAEEIAKAQQSEKGPTGKQDL